MLTKKIGQAISKKLLPVMSQTVSIRLMHGLTVHEATVPCFLTFGQLKETASSLFGIPAEHLRFNYKGRDRKDQDTLAGAGVKNGSKIFVGEANESRAQRATPSGSQEGAAAPERRQTHGSQTSPQPASQPGWETFGGEDAAPQGARAPPPTPVAPKQRPPPTVTELSVTAINHVAEQVDQIQERFRELPSSSNVGREAAGLVEALTQKLLQLDGIEVTAESRHLRKEQINRINMLCDQLERAKLGSMPP